MIVKLNGKPVHGLLAILTMIFTSLILAIVFGFVGFILFLIFGLPIVLFFKLTAFLLHLVF